MEKYDPSLVPPCGLYCGVCSIRLATVDENQKFKERLAPVYGVTPEQIHCRGCLSDTVFVLCHQCSIKTCVGQRGYEGCHECGDFPCSHIDSFPIPVGKKVIMRAIPQWRELGTEKWVEDEEKRYLCPDCGSRLFRGAKKCRNCSCAVDLD